MSSSTSNITALLKKTEHYDKDERYMATSDLCEVLKRHSSGGAAYEGYGKMDAATERRICTAVLGLLKDKSNDVQAVAVKTLGVLLTTVQEEQVLEIADSLADQVLDKEKSDLRDVYAIGLRTLCKEVPEPMGDRVSMRLTPRLLSGLDIQDQDIVLGCLDILTDLLGRFGATAASLTRQHEPILQQCLTQLGSESHMVRKRAGNAIGCLSSVLSDALLARMVESLLSHMDRNTTDTRALIRTMCAVSGAVGHRLGQAQIDRILPIFLKFCQPDEAVTGDDDFADDDAMDEDTQDETAMAVQNELRESCFNGFESFVSRCPTEVETHLQKIVQAALAYMSYDPNYSYGDGEDDDDAAAADGDEDFDEEYDEDEDDEDFEDDDDESWKVRRSATRALSAVVDSKRFNPSMLWNKEFELRRGKSSTVASALVARFKEREENCRVDVIDCFTKLLSVTVIAAANGVVSFASEADMNTTDGVVIDFREKYANSLVKACEKLFSVKKGGDRSKSSALSLLSTLCLAPGGVGGGREIESVFTHVKAFLSMGKASGSGLSREASVNKALKLDALCLVRVMLSCNKHDPLHIRNGLEKLLLADLCLAVKEQWYKVIAEALRVLTEVPPFFANGSDAAGVSDVATKLFEAVEPLLTASDVDQEIKECALSASAALLSSLHTKLTTEQLNRVLSLLLEKLRNETTRIAAIKTLETIGSVPDEDSMEENSISLKPILGEAISVMSSFLKQQSRTLKQHSLQALNIVITHHGVEDDALADGDLFSAVLGQLAGLLVDSDMHLSNLSMQVCMAILKVCTACGPAAKQHIVPPILSLSASPLMQEPALRSLLSLLEQLVSSNAVAFSELLGLLKTESTKDSLGKHAISNLAQCMGATAAAASSSDRGTIVAELLTSLESAGSPSDPADVRRVVLNLLVSGDLGRVVDYSVMDGVSDRIQAIYLGSFDSAKEEIKTAASYALGRSAIGSRSVLLPAIVESLERSDQKRQYLLLSALKEFIQCQQKSSGAEIGGSVPVVLPHLLKYTSDTEESTRTLVAECLGSLAVVDPKVILPKLQELVANQSEIKAEAGHIDPEDSTSRKIALSCWTAATSMKHAIAGKAPLSELSSSFGVFLQLLAQEEIGVRNAALLMVYSAVHHMPQLVSPVMKELILPPLYQIAELKLTRVVDLGPFKHTVDDALPMRKSTMSIFATCLEKMPASLDIPGFMPVLAAALGDLEDVQLQAHHMVISICQHHQIHMVNALDTFVPALETMLTDKAIKRKTANKTGTELDRAKEWIKSCLRALLAIAKLDTSMNNQRFSSLVSRIRKDSKFKPILNALDEEK